MNEDRAYGNIASRLTAGSKLGPWFVRSAVAAAVLSALELLYIVAILPAAGSDGIGLLLYICHLFTIHLVVACCLAELVSLLETFAQKVTWPDSATWTTLFIGVGFTAFFVHTFFAFNLKGQHRQFPERLQQLELAAIVAVLVVCLAVAWLLMRPLLRRLFARIPNLAQPLVVPIIVCLLVSLMVIWITDFGLVPLHLDVLSGPAGVAALALMVVAVRLMWPVIQPRVNRIAIPVVLLPVVLSLWSLGNPPSRYLLYGHTPVAGSLARHFRNLVDFDRDGASPIWLGGYDCDEFNAAVGPAMREIAGDGIDQDCRGGDAEKVSPRMHFDSTMPAGCRLPKEPLSLVIITIDAWQPFSEQVTPNVFTLAKRSTVFPRAYVSATMTDTSLVGLFNSANLSDLSASNIIADSGYCIGVPFVELLRRRGYRTACINPLGTAEAARQGFEENNPRGMEVDPLTVNVGSAFLSAATTNDGLAYIARHRNEPFFLWLHYLDPHAPYRDPYYLAAGQGQLTGYHRRVKYADSQIGRLLEEMSKMNLLSRTAIAFTADHGEALGRRGREGHGPDVFDEIVRVPLVLWVPGCPSRVVDRPVGIHQLGPTMGMLAGVPVPGSTLLSKTDGTAHPVVSEAYYTGNLFALASFRRAVVVGQYKLMVDVRNGGRMLFDLNADPGEETNLYRSHPHIAKDMEAHYQRWLDRPRPVQLQDCKAASLDEEGHTIDFGDAVIPSNFE